MADPIFRCCGHCADAGGTLHCEPGHKFPCYPDCEGAVAR